VVWNLLSNAVKFTPKGGRIEVVAAQVDSHMEIRIIDTGEGISAELMPHIFDRFRQGDGSASRGHGGLGIGLALVKQLVDLHGGAVHASSAGKGHGTTVTIKLPLVLPTNEGVHCHPHPSNGELQYVPVRLKGTRVLVVDDEADALAIVRRVLEENDAVVAQANSAEEALMLLANHSFDVIVSDIGMPVRDGYSLIAEARARGIRTPALAVTAFARADDRAKAISSGYQTHVSKPVQIGEFLAAVASLVRSTNAAMNSPAV
jgi:CheY-like chemotaxis protein/anti-sigma regulatory factor (Ser/Thr protein kinase)